MTNFDDINISLAFAIFEKCLFFLVFHVILSVLMLKKWNFAVILSIKDKSVVKKLKFGSCCMIKGGETNNGICP